MELIEAGGALIPAVGLGTWQLNGDPCVEIVERALGLGYRHLDTAQAHGNEAEVGEGLRASRLPRDEVFVTTKAWWDRLAAGDLERSVEESLARLKLARVDLLLVHWPNPAIPLAETIEALGGIKRAGLARHIGVSNFTAALVEEAVKLSSEPIVVNQVEVHPYLDQAKVIAACRRRGMAVAAHTPIARGKAAGDEVLARIATAHGKSAGQVSLRFLVQQGIIVVPRTSKRERLAENLAIFDFTLSEAEMTEVRGLAGRQGRVVNPPWSPRWD